MKEKFEFRYDLLRHSAYCIVHECVIQALRSSHQVRNIKRDHAEARFRFERFYNRRRNKNKKHAVHFFFYIRTIL